jgi:hypothetical protein
MNRPGDEHDEEEYVVLNPIEDDRVVLNGPNTFKAADDEPRVTLNGEDPLVKLLTRFDVSRLHDDLEPPMHELRHEWRKRSNEKATLEHLGKALRALEESFREADRYARLLVKKYQQQSDTPDGQGFKFPDAGDGKGAFKPRDPEDDRRTARNPGSEESRERQAALDATPVDAEASERDRWHDATDGRVSMPSRSGALTRWTSGRLGIARS